MDRFSYLYIDGQQFTSRYLYPRNCTAVQARLAAQERFRRLLHKQDKCYRLVYFELFTDVKSAIARKKQIKGWRREKKNALVESKNPAWKDLAADWYPNGLLHGGEPVNPKK